MAELQPEADFKLQDFACHRVYLQGCALYAIDQCGNTALLPPEPHVWLLTFEAPGAGSKPAPVSVPDEFVQRTEASSVHFQPQQPPLPSQFGPAHLAGPVRISMVLRIGKQAWPCALGAVTPQPLALITGLHLTLEGPGGAGDPLPVSPAPLSQHARSWCRAARENVVTLRIEATVAEGAPQVPPEHELSWHQRLLRARDRGLDAPDGTGYLRVLIKTKGGRQVQHVNPDIIFDPGQEGGLCLALDDLDKVRLSVPSSVPHFWRLQAALGALQLARPCVLQHDARSAAA